MSPRTHALARGGRTLLVLALLAALFALPVFPVVNAGAVCPSTAPAGHAEAATAPCPGCCAATVAMSCCAEAAPHGEAPASLPSPRPETPRAVGVDLDLPRHVFLSLLLAGLPRNADAADARSSRSSAATLSLRPRSPAQQRALGCLWLI